jgi:hypothetical protein
MFSVTMYFPLPTISGPMIRLLFVFDIFVVAEIESEYG